MPPHPRRALPALAVLAVIVLAAVGQLLWQEVRAEGALTGEAEWIWPATGKAAAPLAAYLVRDFRLDAPPADTATLRALADEEVVLYLNGHRVGSNRYRPGDPLDAYPVAPLLVTGTNRLVAEVRSARGDGGLLAALTVDGEPVAVSGADWRVARRHRPGLVEGWAPIPGEETALSWGRPPVGRWGEARRAVERPRAASAGELCEPVTAEAAVGPIASFDFGRPVTGYLGVELDPATVKEQPRPLALVTTGDDAGGDGETAPRPVLPVPGRPVWTDTVPRTFRHVVVTGLEGPLVATVLPVSAAALDRLPEPAAAPPAGLGGVEPPARLSLLEVLVHRRLEDGAADAQPAAAPPPAAPDH